MSIALTIQKQLQDAMRAGEKLKMDVLRMLLAEVKKTQIDLGFPCDRIIWSDPLETNPKKTDVQDYRISMCSKVF